jgi:glycosyltransferase involved in cell wall biosynthesis
LLIDEQDVSAWEEALTIATGSPERRRRWGTAARERAEERYAWPNIVKDFEALILGELRLPGQDSAQTDPAIGPIA